jgi:hypothetical protein
MNLARSIKRVGLFRMSVGIAFVFVVAVAISPPSAYTDGENVTVSCYKGNLDMGNYVGNVVIFDPNTAGQSCNSLYYDCRGKCYGCFSDFDLSEDVCYDNAGRRFLK